MLSRSTRNSTRAEFLGDIGRSASLAGSIAALVLLCAGSAARAEFTSYNDCVYDSALDGTKTDPNGQSVSYIGNANVTTFGIGVVSADSPTYTQGSQFSNTTGTLIDYGSGNGTGVTATFTENPATNVQWQPQISDLPTSAANGWHGGYDTALGTDARNTFGGKTDMTGVIYYGAAGWYIDLTLTGLDPSKLYTFATTASRSKLNTESPLTYADRVTIYSLSGEDASNNASTAGVTVISPTAVSFVTGNNHAEGYVARWTDIDPGADGTIVIRAEADPTSPEGRKAYSFDVFMLEEQTECGDGVVEGAEECDDNNVVDGDCCSSACNFEPNGRLCDDSNACSTLDSCDGAGTCVAGAALDCDDANGCTDDSCDTGLGCQYVDNTAPCDDANACTDGDICAGGSCQAGGPLDCNDANGCTDDSCDTGLGCQYVDNADPCDDANACTDGDVCSGGVCANLGPLDCDDADPCTADSCDEVLGCAHDSIPLCGSSVPSASAGGRMLVGLLLVSAGALSLFQRRRRIDS